MRRDIWLAGVAGAVVGSWLTLIAVQFGGHGFSLPGRGNSDMTVESKPAPAPTETAKADPTPQKATEAAKPAETAKQDGASPPAAATPAPATDDAAKTPDADSTKNEQSKVTTAEPPSPQDSKVPTDPARSNDASPKPEEAQPAAAATDAPKGTDAVPAPTPQSGETTAPDKTAASSAESTPASPAKVDPAPDNRIPADQVDREMAALTHQTLPSQPLSQPQPQPQPKPESEQASLDPASKPQGQTTTIELVRPFADQAGILTLAGRNVQLTGVIPTDVDRMCTGPNGKSWPCGQAARTAFRMYLRGRSIDCDVPDANWKGTVTGACRYVRIDLSAWLVRFGWADPEPGSPLASLVDEAKQKKRGMYGDDPRKNGKSTLAPPPPKEDPLNPI
ncbi:hypothetical protein GR212_01925 [Rhizobium lusitanum]|uniref:Thermonuclease family protein n=1 Tax=Rhizobium lusitanum TaxID=293958 RepID=A0A6L9U242_9HYPH|nr:thermonuclease family protein [Rhizobium lusitanum]NEI68316.1 hypothetical protein [Rhizobium lusitanum]